MNPYVVWGKGLLAAFVSGMATYIAGLAMGARLSLILKFALFHAATNTAAYLKESPLPKC